MSSGMSKDVQGPPASLPSRRPTPARPCMDISSLGIAARDRGSATKTDKVADGRESDLRRPVRPGRQTQPAQPCPGPRLLWEKACRLRAPLSSRTSLCQLGLVPQSALAKSFPAVPVSAGRSPAARCHRRPVPPGTSHLYQPRAHVGAATPHGCVCNTGPGSGQDSGKQTDTCVWAPEPGARTSGGKKGTSVCTVFLLKKGMLLLERRRWDSFAGLRGPVPRTLPRPWAPTPCCAGPEPAASACSLTNHAWPRCVRPHCLPLQESVSVEPSVADASAPTRLPAPCPAEALPATQSPHGVRTPRLARDPDMSRNSTEQAFISTDRRTAPAPRLPELTRGATGAGGKPSVHGPAGCLSGAGQGTWGLALVLGLPVRGGLQRRRGVPIPVRCRTPAGSCLMYPRGTGGTEGLLQPRHGWGRAGAQWGRAGPWPYRP